MSNDQTEPPAAPTRRCWRCLQEFAESSGTPSRPDEWWVCDACAAILLPSRGARA